MLVDDGAEEGLVGSAQILDFVGDFLVCERVGVAEGEVPRLRRAVRLPMPRRWASRA